MRVIRPWVCWAIRAGVERVRGGRLIAGGGFGLGRDEELVGRERRREKAEGAEQGATRRVAASAAGGGVGLAFKFLFADPLSQPSNFSSSLGRFKLLLLLEQVADTMGASPSKAVVARSSWLAEARRMWVSSAVE